MMNDLYHNKYLKYKNKYASLKNFLSRSIIQNGGSLIALSANLYYTQENDIYYVMERIDGIADRLFFWKKFIQDEEYFYYPQYRLDYLNGKIPKEKGFLKFSHRDQILTSGIVSFGVSLRYDKYNELWIAYVCTKSPDSLDISATDIEMVVTVLTTDNSPMVMHIGILRTFGYMLTASQNREIKLHSNLSIKLHSFAASVTLYRYPNKLYMITAPVPVMRLFLIDAFPNNCYVGDSMMKAENVIHDINANVRKRYQKNMLDIENDFRVIRRLKANYEKAGNLKETQLMEEEYEKTVVEQKNTENQIINEIDNEINALMPRSKMVLDSKLINHFIKDYSIANEEIISNFKQVNELSANIPIDINDSPIRVIGRYPEISSQSSSYYFIQILDKSRTNVVFENDIINNIIIVNGVKIPENENIKYSWFRHPDLSMNPFITINLDAFLDIQMK
jgi:hypothetical protein